MGPLTRILITGASGFVGASATRAARARGIEVVAVYRRNPRPEWADDTGIIPIRIDLSDPSNTKPLTEAMETVGAVIHAAAHLGDDAIAHESDTLRGTQTLLDAMEGFDVALVLVSTIAVYDTMRLEPWQKLDESSPLEKPESARDIYCAAKLRQEQLVRASRRPAWLIRPGVVYGPRRTWNDLMGFNAAGLHVQIGQTGELPLIHVDHLGAVLVQAAVTDPHGLQILNAIDDDRPTRARFLKAHRQTAGKPKAVLPMPYGFWLALVQGLKPISHKLPGLFREPIVKARLMPLHYPNTALRDALGGEDSDRFEVMLAHCTKGAP